MRPARGRKGWELEWWIAALAAAGTALTAAVQILTITKAPTSPFVVLYILSAALVIAAALVGLLKKTN